MRLIELRLKNFRQHADTAISFARGLTGIIGPNGAGKSTILEAIAWAIYGSEAARGTNETLRFSRAPARARVMVELRFELGGHEYRVVRTISSAEAYLDRSEAAVATTLGGVTRYLESRLGMTRREFFNTYFTGQKELQFLATMGPSERGRFLSTVLGYERLRLAQDLARSRRSALRYEIEGLRTGLADPELLAQQRSTAEAQLVDARTALNAAEGEYALASNAISTLAPRWTRAQEARERHRELADILTAVEREREAAARELARADSELERIGQAEAELEGLRERLAPLPALVEESDQFSHLARVQERRRALLEQAEEMRTELERSADRLRRVEKAPTLLERFVEEVGALRAERLSLEKERDERNAKWLEDRQDARTKLVTYRDRGAELQEQVVQIRNAGPDGICPTCGRPLGADFPRLLGELEDQLALSLQDEKWWSAREKQLADRPEDLLELDQRLQELERIAEDRSRKHSRCEAAVLELRTLLEERNKRLARLTSLESEVGSLPSGYDAEAHARAKQSLEALRELETRAARLEEAAARRGETEKVATGAAEAVLNADARAEAASEERKQLQFTEAAFAALRSEIEAASDRLHHSELRTTELRGRVEASEQLRGTAVKAEQQALERAREIEQRDLELRHHSELDSAFTQLRAELNAQVRPELGETASQFLAQLTEGRYTSLEIDQSYNILVLDEGEEKAVISGGEEDVANLVLRLSLSQMIAERSGHPLSLLILDEVFGSLDAGRRDNVIQLLRRLEDRFEQVILITHIEGIRDHLDQVISVSFDERSGSALVRQETFAQPSAERGEVAAD
ncbi:SMC family ATPase [soil metagenome]